MITLIPIIWIFDIALSPGNALGGEIGDSFTDEHFAKILEGESFWLWFRNSLIVSIGTSILDWSLPFLQDTHSVGTNSLGAMSQCLHFC